MSHFDSRKYPASDLQLEKKIEMYRAGFVRKEITYILMIGKEYGAERIAKQFENKAFVDSFNKTLVSRQEWIERQRAKGLSRDQISSSIKLTYDIRSEITPYSLLKDEYRPTPKPRLDFNAGLAKMRAEEKKYNYKR